VPRARAWWCARRPRWRSGSPWKPASRRSRLLAWLGLRGRRYRATCTRKHARRSAVRDVLRHALERRNGSPNRPSSPRNIGARPRGRPCNRCRCDHRLPQLPPRDLRATGRIGMEEIIHSSILATVPLLLAALGGIVAERSGVLNVGLEGLMLAAALATAWAGSASTDFLGFLAALAVALAFGPVLWWGVVAWAADQVVVGIAFNILVLGVTSYLFAVLSRGSFEAMSTSGHTAFPIPGLSDVPWLGQFFQVHWITYTAYVLVPFVFFVLFRTGLGL